MPQFPFVPLIVQMLGEMLVFWAEEGSAVLFRARCSGEPAAGYGALL